MHNIQENNSIEEKEPENIRERFFSWYREDDFHNQAIFFKPTFSTIEAKIKQLILDPLVRLQQVARIKAPEIIKDPFVKSEEDYLEQAIETIEKT